MNAWNLSQIESLETATRWGRGWTTAELELVETSMDEKTATVASVLERSVFAVSTMRGLVRNGYSIHQLANDKSRKVEIKINVCENCHLVTPVTGCDCGV